MPNGLELREASPEGIRAAPRACEGQLPGGSGNAPPILAQLDGHGTTNFPHASRVSCSEVLARPLGVLC